MGAFAKELLLSHRHEHNTEPVQSPTSRPTPCPLQKKKTLRENAPKQTGAEHTCKIDCCKAKKYDNPKLGFYDKKWEAHLQTVVVDPTPMQMEAESLRVKHILFLSSPIQRGR